MSHRRRYYKRRNGSMQFLSKAEKALSIGSKALALATNVASLVNVEFKRNDASGSLNPTTSGTVTQLCTIAGGSDAVQRVGDEVELKSFNFKASMSQNASATDTVLRMLIVLDTENRGSAPALTDVLQSADVRDFVNWDNRKRFRILKDQLYSFGDRTDRVYEYYKNFGTRGLKLEWTTTSFTSTNNNSIWLICLSNEPTNTPSVVFKSRSVYIDN